MSEHNRENKDDEDKSCCTWPKIIFMVLVAVVGTILIWRFAPIDKAIDSVLPTFNNTGGDSGGSTGGESVPRPTLAPTQDGTFDFMQCQDPSRNCCNGLDSICDLGVDDILYATVHNAMATSEDGFLFLPNHHFKLEDALEAGYRGINLDVCNCGGNYQFCHGVCHFGARDIVEVFANINRFLDLNPTEVVAIPLQINNGVGDTVDIKVLYNLMLQVPGFTDKFYVHENLIEDWPTLRESIDANKRVLMFYYNSPECKEPDDCPAGLHYYWNYAIETQWDFETLTDIQATSNSCDFRTTAGAVGRTFFGVNNFITPPAQDKAKTVNEFDFAKNRIAMCSELNENLDVNFILVDFWSEGDLPRLTQEHNAALASRRRKLFRGTA